MLNKKNDGTIITIRCLFIILCLCLILFASVFKAATLAIIMFMFIIVLTVRIVSVEVYSLSGFDNKIISFLFGPSLDVIYFLIISLCLNGLWIGILFSTVLVLVSSPFIEIPFLRNKNITYKEILSLFKSDYKRTRGLTRKTQKYLLTNFPYNTSRLFNLLDCGAKLTKEQVVIINNLVDIAKQREIDTESEDVVLIEIGSVITAIYEKLKREMNEKKKEEKTIKSTINEGLVSEINALKEMV